MLVLYLLVLWDSMKLGMYYVIKGDKHERDLHGVCT